MKEEMNFETLTLGEKKKKILDEGVLISKTKFYGVEIFLYRIDNKFFEIWYEDVLGKISKIRYLDRTPYDPFLKHFKVSTLN